MLCDDQEGWRGGVVGGRLQRDGMYVYVQLIHVVVCQKLTHYKPIILQLKKKKLLRGESI